MILLIFLWKIKNQSEIDFLQKSIDLLIFSILEPLGWVFWQEEYESVSSVAQTMIELSGFGSLSDHGVAATVHSPVPAMPKAAGYGDH